MKISPHLLVKRLVNYRKSKPKEADCRFCESLRFYGSNIKTQRRQCEIIGVSYDKYADVDHLHICDCYERIDRPERYDYKIFLQGEKNESD